MREKVLNVEFDNLDFADAVKQIMSRMYSSAKLEVFFLNSDCLFKCQRDSDYYNILKSTAFVLADGVGLKFISRFFGINMLDNCNGSEIGPALIEQATKKGYNVFFLGGKEEIAEKAADNIRMHMPGIRIVGTHHGFFTEDEEIINQINASGADLLFVAMGVPLQEKWIYKNREKLNPRLCLGVGALLDYLSGTIPRAPKFMRAIHLEWLWRIFIEPKRMLKRYIIDGTKLFWLVLKYKFRPGRV